MINSKQYDELRALIGNYRDALDELHTAAPEHKVQAAYEFTRIDQMIHELLGSWVSSEDTTAGDSDGWIEWGGGDCPCDHMARVEVRLRGGNERVSRAPLSWAWTHHNNIWDVVAYRMVSE